MCIDMMDSRRESICPHVSPKCDSAHSPPSSQYPVGAALLYMSMCRRHCHGLSVRICCAPYRQLAADAMYCEGRSLRH